MPGRLFVVGVNTIGLRYCENDCRRLAECLTLHYDYEVVRPAISYGGILESFAHFLDQCSTTDTAIVYFSGHGVPRAGRLFFPLRDEMHKRANKIDLSQIVRDFQECEAQSRLIILDCCHATETAKVEWPLSQSDKYLVLAASKVMETAKEIAEFEGGLLTTKLVELLTSPPEAIKATNGKLYVQAVFRELSDRVKKYQAEHPDENIFLPNLLGNQAVDFPIGTPPISHTIVVLSAIAQNRGSNLTEIAKACSGLSTVDFAAAIARLREDRCVEVMHNIAILLREGHERLKQSTMPVRKTSL